MNRAPNKSQDVYNDVISQVTPKRIILYQVPCQTDKHEITIGYAIYHLWVCLFFMQIQKMAVYFLGSERPGQKK